jgi:hypothetical protein
MTTLPRYLLISIYLSYYSRLVGYVEKVASRLFFRKERRWERGAFCLRIKLFARGRGIYIDIRFIYGVCVCVLINNVGYVSI